VKDKPLKSAPRFSMDSGQPAEDSPGGRWAILAWNIGDQNTNRKKV